MKTIKRTQKSIIKRTSLSLLILLVAISLSSCEEETALVEKDPTSFSEGYSVSRTSGNDYTLTYKTSKDANTSTDKIGTGKYSIFFFEELGMLPETHTQTFPLENDNLQVSFVAQNAELSTITITDKKSESNITGRTAGGVTGLLNSYKLMNTGGNTYQIDFEVPAGVAVSFNQNSEGIYQIHLTEGGSSTTTATNHSQNYNKQLGVDLVIEFVNHTISTTARTTEDPEKRPIIVIINDEDGGGN